MKPITMYQANDGSVWPTATEAELRDHTIAECEGVVKGLGLRPVPKDTEFGNGGGYVQQPKGSRDALYAALEQMGAHRDSNGPVGDLLYRAMRLDAHDREWGQPYFAAHPEKGKQVNLTPEEDR